MSFEFLVPSFCPKSQTANPKPQAPSLFACQDRLYLLPGGLQVVASKLDGDSTVVVGVVQCLKYRLEVYHAVAQGEVEVIGR